MDASKAIGGPIEVQALALQKLFVAQRLFLSIVPYSNKPGPKVKKRARGATRTNKRGATPNSRVITHQR
jgi:hypothetical protein